MEAIPTTYNGINFRSRLEATWAAFFDLLGWRYDYEPVSFNGYIPDFFLYSEQLNPIIVEIKPFYIFQQFQDTGTLTKVEDGVKETPYANNAVLFLGVSPFSSVEFEKTNWDVGEDPCWLGWVNEHGWGCNQVVMIYNGCNKDWFSPNGSWGSNLFKTPKKFQDANHNKWVFQYILNYKLDIEPLWIQAKNLTQWKNKQDAKNREQCVALKKRFEGVQK